MRVYRTASRESVECVCIAPVSRSIMRVRVYRTLMLKNATAFLRAPVRPLVTNGGVKMCRLRPYDPFVVLRGSNPRDL